MISVAEAKNKILEYCPAPIVKQVPLDGTCGFVLAENIYAPFDIPHFNQSAMDGYAFSFDGWDGKSALTVVSEVQAGNIFAGNLKPLQALRIFTGAAIPACADTVVVQEKVMRENNKIFIRDEKLAKGNNVRPAGSQTKKDETVLPKGQLLTPASISLLAGFGLSYVNVFSLPTVSIIATGKELLRPDEPLTEGKIYESNSLGLKAALQQLGITPASIQLVDDNEAAIAAAISSQLHVDILILTGGVSVGDYDFVIAALEKCAVSKVFHRVKQKPGKPLYFGTFNKTLVFGLPGNPASVLTCFYEYITDAISCFTQKKYSQTLSLPLADDFRKPKGLTFFLKGSIAGNKVGILQNQESYKMNSFAQADSIIELDEEKEIFHQNEMVKVRLIT